MRRFIVYLLAALALMPVTVSHSLSATTPDNPAFEIQPKHWNSNHIATINAAGSEISGAFGNGGGITFGLSADGKVTAAAPAGAPSPVHISAGTTESDIGTVVFADSNGLAFGLSGSTITGSYSQSTHAHPFIAAIVSGANGNGTFTSGTLSVKAGNNVTLSTGAGVFSIHGEAAQSVQTQNLFVEIVSGANGNLTQSSGTLSVKAGNNITLSTGAGVYSIHGVAAQTNQSAIKAFGVSNTGATAGNTGVSTGIDWVLAGSNLLTLSQSTAGGGPNTVWIQHPAWLTTARGSTDAVGLNTAKTNVTWTVNSSGLSFDAGGYAGTGTSATNASITLNTAGLAISVNAGGAGYTAGLSNIGNTAGDTVTVTGRLVLAGSNGITLSGSSNAGSLTITISGITQSVQTQNMVAVIASGGNGNGTFSSGTVSLKNGSNITMSTGANVISFYAPDQTVQTQNFVAIIGSGANGNGTFTSGTLSLKAGNNITLSTGANVVSVHGVAAQTTQTQDFAAIIVSGANGNLTQTSGTLSIKAGNNITLSTGANVVSIHGAVAQAGVGGIAASNTTYTSGTVYFSGVNLTVNSSVNGASQYVQLSVAAPGAAAESNAFNLLGANTAGNTTATGSTIGLSGVNLTLSGTNNSQIVISAPPTSSFVGESGISLSSNGSTISIRPSFESYWAYPQFMYNSQTQTVAGSVSVVWPLELWDLEAVSHARIAATVSIASMASIATAANNTKSYNQQGTFNWVMYSRGIGASSQSLQSVWSTSYSSRMSIAVGQNANGSQWTATHNLTFYDTAGSTSTGFSYATTLSNVNISTTHMTALSGMKFMGFPLTTTISAQRYWLAFGFTNTHTTNGNASLSNMRVTWSHWGMTQPNNTWGEFGSANNASVQQQRGLGSYSNGAGATTASLGFSDISSSASHMIPYITFGRIA